VAEMSAAEVIGTLGAQVMDDLEMMGSTSLVGCMIIMAVDAQFDSDEDDDAVEEHSVLIVKTTYGEWFLSLGLLKGAEHVVKTVNGIP